MKIALFSETYLPQINGVATHIKTLKEGLETLGHRVLVVTADPKAAGHYVEHGILHCPAAELKDLYGYGMAASYSPERMRFIKEFSPDIAHVHTEFGIGSTGLETARELRIPLIYTLHTMWDEYLHYIASPTLFLRSAGLFMPIYGISQNRPTLLSGHRKKYRSSWTLAVQAEKSI